MNCEVTMWYAVHAFLYFQYKDGSQDEYFGYENIYLVEADSVEEARTKGIARAKKDEGDSEGTLTSNGRPATLVFGGLLKFVECTDLDLQSEKPVDGTELSYSEMTMPNKQEFDNFVSGHTAKVIYHGVEDD
jgi:Domain of unknown function (DUF4288)